MQELTMMEAALFQLRAALDDDDPAQMAIRISAGLLTTAIESAKNDGVNAARANDITFALNDLVTAIEDAGAPDVVRSAAAMLQRDAATLAAASSLPEEVLTTIRSLKAKLKARKIALERGQYRAEGAPEVAPPHPPEELREDAIPLARMLTAAGFATPALDALIADPSSLRYHSVNEIIDELDVISGE